MCAKFPFKPLSLFILIILLTTALSGCKPEKEPPDSQTGAEQPNEIEEPVALPPGDDLPGGSQMIANDPLPTLMLPDSSFDLGTGSSLPLKPVRFRNLGTVAYTVSPLTYVPADDSVPPIAALVSTVAFPGGSNSSSSLSLPLGTYTWCYHWELGDANDDGILEYAHAIDSRPVVLDENDSDDLDLAETVDLAAPATSGAAYGVCGLEIAPFVVGQNHADTIMGPLVNMGHDADSVTLRGPITVAYYYIHATEEIRAGVPRQMTAPEIVVISEWETRTFELVDGREDHPGDWNMYIWLLSIDG